MSVLQHAALPVAEQSITLYLSESVKSVKNALMPHAVGVINQRLRLF